MIWCGSLFFLCYISQPGSISGNANYKKPTQWILAKINPFTYRSLNLWKNRSFWTNGRRRRKFPSVRDLAAELQVNPNTVMRAYDFFSSRESSITAGIGNHVSPNAGEKILEARKEKFLQTDLPSFFKNMHLLEIGLMNWNAFIKISQWISKAIKIDPGMKKSNILLFKRIGLAFCWTLLIGWFASYAIIITCREKILISPIHIVNTWKATGRSFLCLRVNCVLQAKVLRS